MTSEPNGFDAIASVAMTIAKIAVFGLLAFEAYAFWVITP